MVKKLRFVIGQDRGERLAHWLNGGVADIQRSGIRRLVWDLGDFLNMTRDLRQKGIHRDPHHRRVPRVRPTEGLIDYWLGEEIKELCEEIEARLLPYWKSTQLSIRWPAQSDQAASDIIFETTWKENSECSEEETEAFLDLIALVRAGKLHHLKQCDHCSRWMFVRFPEGKRPQTICLRLQCKQEARTNFMREYQAKRRKEERERDLKTVKKIRRKGPNEKTRDKPGR